MSLKATSLSRRATAALRFPVLPLLFTKSLVANVIVPAIESAFQMKFLSKDVYLIPDLPSDLQLGDVLAVSLMALALSFLATVYPSWRAARLNPAEALRYE